MGNQQCLLVLSKEASKELELSLVTGHDLCKFVLKAIKTWAVVCERGVSHVNASEFCVFRGEHLYRLKC